MKFLVQKTKKFVFNLFFIKKNLTFQDSIYDNVLNITAKKNQNLKSYT
jgi:hypothetical protein